MATKLAYDYEDKTLSSFIRWLDITRPGSKHDFQYLVDFFINIKIGRKKVIIEKIESSINKNIEDKLLIKWFEKNPPLTSKGSIDYLEALIRTKANFDKTQMIKNIWIKQNLTSSQQKYFTRNYSNF